MLWKHLTAGIPSPEPQAGTVLWPARNQFAQQEVSGR